MNLETNHLLGSGWDAIGRVVASDTIDPWVESNHHQFYLLGTYQLDERKIVVKMKIKKKEAGKVPI